MRTPGWLPIEDFPNYEVSRVGKIRNKNTGKILYIGNSDGYQYVILYRNGKRFSKRIHLLVANAFYDVAQFECNVTQFGCEVHHKNLNKCNNCVHNLEFLSKSEHAGKHARKVRLIETGEIFDSISSCARHIHGNHSNLSACLHGRLSTHKGFHFEYAE